MPAFGRRSQHQLRTCIPELQAVFERVVLTYDCSILTGHRGETAQNGAFDDGLSKVRWPDGEHNEYPSKAVDAAPYPIAWGGPLIVQGELSKANLNAILRFHHFAGFVQAIAESMGTPLRWGGDWDSDRDLADQTFNDLIHFEVR